MMASPPAKPPIPRIFIDKEGRWFQNGIPITHRWTYLENNRNLRHMNDGYKVVEGGVSIPVEVEDTPFVIVSAEVTENGISVGINDETSGSSHGKKIL